jgi:ribonuclease Z
MGILITLLESPYIISQKAMNSQEAPKFYMPKSLVEPLDRIMKIWQEIEEHEYKYEFIAVGRRCGISA